MRSLIFFLLVSFNATAALYDRGNGLIYDDVLDITWLQDANYSWTSGYDSDGLMIWDDVKLWVNNLNYSGYDQWRLPSANLMNETNPCYGFDGSCDLGYNNITSELGYMYKVNLSNFPKYDMNGNPRANNYEGIGNVNFTDSESGEIKNFINFYPPEPVDHQWGIHFWLEEENISDTNQAWAFYTSNGRQVTYPKDANGAGLFSSWPVHDGDIGLAPVPLPAGIYLFLSGLVGLGLMRGRNG